MVLYKYASASSGIKILEDLTVKVSPPNEFNDPFELTPRSRNTISGAQMIAEAKANPEHFRPVFDNLAREGHRGSFDQFIKDLPSEIGDRNREIIIESRKQWAKKDADSVDEASKFMGILCLSSLRDSVLLGSHYADNHTGVAIGLDVAANCFARRVSLDKVRYRKLRATIDISANQPMKLFLKQIANTILTKSAEWSYEKEHRMVFRLKNLTKARSRRTDDGRNYFVHIRPSTIKEVVMGCRIEAASEASIKSILTAKRFAHVRLFRAERHRSSFTMKLISVPIERRVEGNPF